MLCSNNSMRPALVVGKARCARGNVLRCEESNASTYHAAGVERCKPHEHVICFTMREFWRSTVVSTMCLHVRSSYWTAEGMSGQPQPLALTGQFFNLTCHPCPCMQPASPTTLG
jgi:hypothetical protein